MNRPLVYQTDFGLSDGAVSAMYGVAITVDPNVRIFDLTHEIPQYNIWEASYRLYQTVTYWPEETVFVSVVDPGVGSKRKSVVAKTVTQHYIVTPDNGTLSHLKKKVGIEKAWVIDERKNRLPQAGKSYTFHGRDIFAYTGARIATRKIQPNEVGPEMPVDQLIELPIPIGKIENDAVFGIIDTLDVRFGNLWTNIEYDLFRKLKVNFGDHCEVTIKNGENQVYKNVMTFDRTFSESFIGEPLLFINSLDNIGVAMNQASFANAYQVKSGLNWKIKIRKV